MSWRDRAAQILEKGPGGELKKPNKPILLPNEGVISVYSVPPLPASGDDPDTERRRQIVLAGLDAYPDWKYIGHTELTGDGVILALAIRGSGTLEICIPNEKWDGVLFIEKMDKRNVH